MGAFTTLLSGLRQSRGVAAIIATTVVISVVDLFTSVDLLSIFRSQSFDAIQGQWWRPFSANLIHNAGVVHLALNMLGLSLAGPAVERAVGPYRIVALYSFAGFTGWAIRALRGHGGAGASPAVVGVFGALLLHAWIHRKESREFRSLLLLALVLSVLWLCSGLVLDNAIVSGLGRLEIADDAHLVGFATGALLQLGWERWCTFFACGPTSR